MSGIGSENALTALKQLTTVVADTGDFESIVKYLPQDATTNPSLILSAIKMDKYAHLLKKAAELAHKNAANYDVSHMELTMDYLFVLFGVEILKIVPGRVSTEVDARLSFDVLKQIEKARRLIAIYNEFGINKNRVLVKLSSTWEGIKAAKVLECEDGIHCNLTLLFSLAQAVACADSKVSLISPFVGRIFDWHKENRPNEPIKDPSQDPGVRSVKNIYKFYKENQVKTSIMGASFRNVDQVLQLAGCDLLTVSPKLLEELTQMPFDTVQRNLSVDGLEHDYPVELTELVNECITNHQKCPDEFMNETRFRWFLNEDEMASDKLADGIRKFARDAEKLQEMVKQSLSTFEQ